MSDVYTGADKLETYLEHHGIKGMKWGVRRYQNKDGSLTPAGKVRKSKQSRRMEKVKDAAEIIVGAAAGAGIAVALGLGGASVSGVILSAYAGSVIGLAAGALIRNARLAITGGQIADSMNLDINKIKTAGTDSAMRAHMEAVRIHNEATDSAIRMHNMSFMNQMATMHNIHQMQMHGFM